MKSPVSGDWVGWLRQPEEGSCLGEDPRLATASNPAHGRKYTRRKTGTGANGDAGGSVLVLVLVNPAGLPRRSDRRRFLRRYLRGGARVCGDEGGPSSDAAA